MLRLLSLTLAFLFAICFTACEKDEILSESTTVFDAIGRLNPATISAYGQLTDDAGDPVADAIVVAGDATTTTDIQGLWRLDNFKVYATFGYISFESDGYLHGSRTVYARKGSTYEVNVELLSRDQTFFVDAASGGTVRLPNSEATVAFGPGAFAKTDGTPITSGSVSVVAHYLDPNDPRTYDRMPGDLRGVSAERQLAGPQNGLSLLTSYGMIAVELRSGGVEVKLTDGKTATLTLPLTGAAAATAPSSIPLWYFDEAVGVWREEGSATRQGNAYVGTVSHFTFWNCDVPNDFVELCGNVGFEAVGMETAPRTTPLQVRMTSARFGTRTTYVDAMGNFCGAVPRGEVLTLGVIGDCGEVVFAKFVGPYSNDTVLDPFIVPSDAARLLRVSGRVTCDGVPLPNTAVTVTQEIRRGATQRVNADGTFMIEILICTESPIKVTAIDYASLRLSTTLQFEIQEDLAVGDIETCEALMTSFLRLTVNGDVVFFTENIGVDADINSVYIESERDSTQLDGASLRLLLVPNLTNAEPGTYTVGPTSRASHDLGLMGTLTYDLTGTKVTSTKTAAPTGIRVRGSIPMTEVCVTDQAGATSTTNITLDFSYLP